MDAKIINVAKKIRRILEKFQRDFPKNKWSKDLAGSCATSSFLLKDALAKIGINSNIHEGREKGTRWSHVWVETENYLVDVTFTQFDSFAPKVLVIKKNTKKYLKHRQAFTRVKLKNSLVLFSDWIVIQRPKPCINKMKQNGLYETFGKL